MATSMASLAVTLGAALLLASGAVACGDEPRSGPAVVAGQPAGEVKAVTGAVRVVRAGQERTVRVGEPITGDDEVRTGADGRIAVVLWHNQVIWNVGPDQRRVVGDSLAWRAPRAAAVAAGPDVVSAPAGRHVEREAADTSASAGEAAPASATAEENAAPALAEPVAADKKRELGRAQAGQDERLDVQADPPPHPKAPQPVVGTTGSPNVRSESGPGARSGGGGKEIAPQGPHRDDGLTGNHGTTELGASPAGGLEAKADDTAQGAGQDAERLDEKAKRGPAPGTLTTQIRSGPLAPAAAQATLVGLQSGLRRCGLEPTPVTLVITVRANGTVAALSGKTATGAALASAKARCARTAVSAVAWPKASAASTVSVTLR